MEVTLVVAVSVGVTVTVGVAVGVAVGCGVSVGVAVGCGVSVGVAVGARMRYITLPDCWAANAGSCQRTASPINSPPPKSTISHRPPGKAGSVLLMITCSIGASPTWKSIW